MRGEIKRQVLQLEQDESSGLSYRFGRLPLTEPVQHAMAKRALGSLGVLASTLVVVVGRNDEMKRCCGVFRWKSAQDMVLSFWPTCSLTPSCSQVVPLRSDSRPIDRMRGVYLDLARVSGCKACAIVCRR